MYLTATSSAVSQSPSPNPRPVSWVVRRLGTQSTMSEELLDRWEYDFRAAARADGCAMFRKHLRHLRLSELHNRHVRRNEPRLMLEATVSLVRMICAYATIDNHAKKLGRFLNMQKYNPSDATDARYVFTFDLYKAFARVLVKTKDRTIDLADLYGCAWSDYKVVGFHHLWISHPDWSNLTNGELLKLENEVEYDLRCDYAEDELDLSFDDSLDEIYLFVTAQDVYESEDESDD